MSRTTIRWSVAGIAAIALSGVSNDPLSAQAAPNVTQAGAATAGTFQPSGVAPAARDALFAAFDAAHRWAFMDAYEQASHALAADSTFGLARVYRTSLGAAPTQRATDAQYRRAIEDAAGRPAPEQMLLLGERFTGVNANRFYTAARQAYPNDRNVALDQSLALAGRERADSLRSLVTQYPDLLGARLWLTYYLAPNFYGTSQADAYDALAVARGAVAIAPRVAGSHMAMGHALHYIGRDDEAVTHLVAATKLDPRAEYAYVLEAEIYMHDGKPQRVERARAALDSAIASSPSPGRRQTERFNRALLLFYDGRAAEGMAEVIAVTKDDEAAGVLGTAATRYSEVAELSAGIGDSASVDKWLGEARRVSPNTNVFVQTIQALTLGKQPAAARRAYEEGARLLGDSMTGTGQANAHRLRGMILVADGKPTEAIAEFKQSDPLQNPFLSLSLIDAYTALKDQKSADATRAALLTRKDVLNSAVSIALANYRAVKRK
jgi:hypothetical protein